MRMSLSSHEPKADLCEGGKEIGPFYAGPFTTCRSSTSPYRRLVGKRRCRRPGGNAAVCVGQLALRCLAFDEAVPGDTVDRAHGLASPHENILVDPWLREKQP